MSHEAHNTSLPTAAQTLAISSSHISQMEALRFREVNLPRLTRPDAGCRDSSLPPLDSGLCSLRTREQRPWGHPFQSEMEGGQSADRGAAQGLTPHSSSALPPRGLPTLSGRDISPQQKAKCRVGYSMRGEGCQSGGQPCSLQAKTTQRRLPYLRVLQDCWQGARGPGRK